MGKSPYGASGMRFSAIIGWTHPDTRNVKIRRKTPDWIILS